MEQHSSVERSTALRDIIYFDFEKAASLFSQLEWGLIKEIQSTLEDTTETSTRGGIDLRYLTAGTDDRNVQRRAVLESRILYHDLLARLEQRLEGLNVLADLGGSVAPTGNDEARELLDGRAYIRARGKTVFEDFERLKTIADRFNDLSEFIATSAASDQIEADPMAAALRQELQSLYIQAHPMPEGQRRARLIAKATERQLELNARVRAVAGVDEISSTLIDGVKLWIETFMAGRLTARSQPFPSVDEFEVIANLKHDCFFDSDFGHLRITYGSRPNLDLTMLGLVASVPPRQSDARSSPAVAVPTQTSQPTEQEAFEAAFRAMFPALEELEDMARFERYPSVTVYPLALYREVSVATLPPPPPRISRLRRLLRKLQ